MSPLVREKMRLKVDGRQENNFGSEKKRKRDEDIELEDRNEEESFPKSQMTPEEIDIGRREEIHSNNFTNNVPPTTEDRSVHDEVERLHLEVASAVKSLLNTYYPHAKKFMYDEYREMAKSFSHRLRREIKESYKAFHNGSLQGITFTFDNYHYLKNVLEIEFNKMPSLHSQKK